MDHFHYQDSELFAENVPVAKIAAEFGTPTYLYSRATLTRHFQAYQRALGNHPHLICFAVKANANIAVLNVLAKLGAGFDIVSVGELERVLAAGGDPKKVVFSGVGKQPHEMHRALSVGVHCFNVESIAELEQLQAVASDMDIIANISIRVNPDVDPQTHPYISTGLKENKFGIDINEAIMVYEQAACLSHIHIIGIDCHIGSQLTSLPPFLDALDRLLGLVDALEAKGITIQHLDLGGGLGVPYQNEQPPEPDTYASAILERLGNRALELVFEPGRSIAANAGILITRVDYLKPTATKHFAIVDAAMNDLLRPALYQAWQEIIPVTPRHDCEPQTYDVVGAICETSDFLGKDRELAILPQDLLAVRSAGAYGFVMSSNYNTRNRAAEVMVDGDHYHLIRKRETITEQLTNELLLPE
ncbi:diaminopimelate decarboxylase [Zooshikella harenae]|uniref:Diaminopimelate decarboxylase n=1 Tax=Zooshikella harenae TaxID=2827238 RepID=A0ABS5ZHV4_9GAMM|nr:diaminopimelate decarboxylase [Zooshikella harenae]MBU2712587.1 diaminopimelate decarboxylase [Zooshikella harenae]